MRNLTPLVLGALVGTVCLVGAGCALTQKSAPIEFRYFTPEAVTTPDAVPQPTSAGAAKNLAGRDLEVRLGQVNAASHIRDRIAFRDEGHELGYYEELRWTEKPEAYLRRAIGRALFQGLGVKELIAKPGPTLEIELDAFEELRSPRHVARVEITWSLRDEESVHVQRTFVVERPIASVKSNKLADALAGAMAAALSEAVAAIVDGTVAELAHTTSQARPSAMGKLHPLRSE